MDILFDAVEDSVAVPEKGTVFATTAASQVGGRALAGTGDGGGDEGGQGVLG